MTEHDLRAQDLTLGYDADDVIGHLDVEIPDGGITVIVGANACGKSTLLRGLARLLQAAHRHGPARRPLSARDAQCRRRPRAWPVAADARGAGRHHGGRPRGPRPVPPPRLVPAVERRRRRRGDGRPRDHRHGRSRRPPALRAVRRSASAGVDRDGPGAGDGPAAARRADDLPGHQPPGRAAGPADRPEPGPRHDDRPRHARPQPGVPLRRPRHRDEARRDRGRGRTGRRHRCRTSCPTSSACAARSCPTRSAARPWSCRADATMHAR